ncbi:MAG TPA: hypothetical protein VHY84_18915 [Bryobacteraceae bacterium]|jgi:hypothetical protein|nr:hypothetical protein [Bryobacteraceae bacterium]
MKFKPNPFLKAMLTTGTKLVDSLFVWLGERIDASRRRRDIAMPDEPVKFALPQPGSKVSEIAARPLAEARLQDITPHPVLTHSLNLSRRARAMHMRRRGDEPHTIAAALGLSLGEVELMFKLEHLLQHQE